MQGNRYVLWNFDNVAQDKSGTIEFRGGRFLRGEVRTKRWMAFTVAFIHAMLQLVTPLTAKSPICSVKITRLKKDLGNPSPNGHRVGTKRLCTQRSRRQRASWVCEGIFLQTTEC